MPVLKAKAFNDIRLYRYHLCQHLYSDPRQFPLNFLDGGFRLRGDGRYGGVDLNPAHYFSVSEEGCTAELLAADGSLFPTASGSVESTPQARAVLRRIQESRPDAPSALLEVELSCDRIADLVDPGTVFEELQRWGLIDRKQRIHTGDVFLRLATDWRGGDQWTDVLGKAAHLSQLNGLRVLNARILDNRCTGIFGYETARKALAEFPFADEALLFNELLERIADSFSNLIFFRGTYVASAVRRFRLTTAEERGDWLSNPYFGRDELELEPLMVEGGGMTHGEMELRAAKTFLEFLDDSIFRGHSLNPAALSDLLIELPCSALPRRQAKVEIHLGIAFNDWSPGKTEAELRREVCRGIHSLGPGRPLSVEVLSELVKEVEAKLRIELVSEPHVRILEAEVVGPGETLHVVEDDVDLRVSFPGYRSL